MGKQVDTASSTEQERQGLIAELLADHGPQWVEQYKPGTFGCHELLDRTSLIAAAVEGYILSHPACLANPDWYALAEQAVTALNELYQRVGQDHLSDEAADA